MKKGLSMLLAASLAVTSLEGAATAFAEESDGFSVNACIAPEPQTLDPNQESSADGGLYSMHMFEGLMKYAMTDEDAAEGDDAVKLMTYDYGQAESYEVSDDGLTYTFTLRDDIYWSDGEPVTAADFEYSWKRIVDPGNAFDYGYILDGVVLNAEAIQGGEMEPDELGITAVDDKTLEITLEAACPYFLDLCAFAALMPLREDVIEEYGNAWTDPGNMVSNGAYVLNDWVHDSYIEMVKNDQYYGEVGPDTITWYLSDSETQMLAAYQAGEYDFIEAMPLDQIEALQESGDCWFVDMISTSYLYLSCDNIPDWRVRAAITLAIDRDNIVENVTQSGQTPATGLVAAGITTYDGSEWTETYGAPLWDGLAEMYPDYDLTTYSERCELAQELLDEAVADGYDADKTIDFEFSTSDGNKVLAEAIQADVNSVLGLNISLNNSEWQAYTSNLYEGHFGMASLGWIADYDDASTYLELFTNDSSGNYSNWVNDDYTALIAESKSLPDSQERDDEMAEAEAMLFEEGGFALAPLYFYSKAYCINDTLKNVGWSPLGYFIFTYATQE